MALRIQLRRDTASNWAANNPVLLSGELGIETDTNRFKIGNNSRWNAISSYAFKVGEPNGVASLGPTGKIPTSQIPDAISIDAEIADAIANISTSNVAEGSNQYFTEERAVLAVADAIAAAISTASSDATQKSNAAQTAAISTASSDATQKATAAELSAITVAAIDASQKSTSAKNEAISESATYIDEQIANEAAARSEEILTAIEQEVSDRNQAIADSTSSADLSTKTTNDLSEGSSNLYFTPERARTANNDRFTAALISTNEAIDLQSSIFAATYITEEAADLKYVASSNLDNTLSDYVLESDRNGQNGFAGLDSNSLLSDSVIPESIARSSDVNSSLALKSPVLDPVFTNNATVSNTLNVNNLEINGSLTFNGTATTINSTNTELTDSIIYLAAEQYDSDIVDIGIYGAYGSSGGTLGTHHHTGLFRDATDGVWKLISNGSEPVGNVVDLTDAVYDSLKIGSLELSDLTVTGTINGITKSSVGLSSVDNTSDEDKPVSTLTSAALDLKANLASPSFTGIVDFSSATVTGLDSSLPSQVGSSGSFLTTDGTNLTWEDINLDSYLTVSTAESTYATIDNAKTYGYHSNVSDTAANRIAYGTSATGYSAISSPVAGDIYIQY